ncbi:hypothetical protein ACFFLS_19130 [Flavobacterium procerum]|uniref:Uncharacterized protein n=1 Tax=Flavobacterium procerum TaxID=1455569 RepID=A0ABV6BYP1_9FLAO
MNLIRPNFLKITNQFSAQDFEKLKIFILKKGNRKTFRNFDNNNPYYDFGTFEAYLGADVGQQNIYNDEKLSDFNEMTLRDENLYYKIVIVRKGDIQSSKKGILDGMTENEVFYTGVYQEDLSHIPALLLEYLERLKTEIQ